MKTKHIAIALIAVLVVSVSLGALSDADAQVDNPVRERTISVTGMATSSVQPDLLTIQLGIETQGQTASEALNANSELMNKVINSLKSVEIKESEISTSALNIYAQYEYIDNGIFKRETRELVGYEASNIITIETKNLDLAASIIDSSVNAGANRVDSVYFSISPEKHMKLKDELLEQAVTNAKSRADTSLVPLDQKIIGVQSVSIAEFGMPYPEPIYRMEAVMADAEFAMAAPTPVFSSEQDVSTSVHVVFLIGSN